MKRRIVLYICLCVVTLCLAQQDYKHMSDSLTLISRAKADMVLSHFDTIVGKKILYSVYDKDYYIIILTGTKLYEYIVSTDSAGNIAKLKELDNEKLICDLLAKKYLSMKERRVFKRLAKGREIVIKAFDLRKYLVDLSADTYLPPTKITLETPQYFVLKDSENNRYVEDRFFSPGTSFIDLTLWGYLSRELFTPTSEFLNNKQ